MTSLNTLVVAVALAAEPGWYCAASKVEAIDGAVRLARQWRQVFGEGFDAEPAAWAIENYQNKLQIARSPEGALVAANRGATGDTAFELASPPIAVRAGSAFRLTFRWRSSRSLETVSGHQGHYLTELQWLDAGGREVAVTPFAFGRASDDWQPGRVDGTVPEGAQKAVVRFGFDHPNLENNQLLALDDVSLEQRVDGAFDARGTLLSKPLRAAGAERKVSWEADTPAGATVRVRVAGAPDRDGSPGAWTAFGDPGEPQLDGLPWLRYEATGGVTDGPWSGPDERPPVVAERSATRTADAAAPLWFVLRDETGIDRAGLRLSLDGEDITTGLRAAGDRFTWQPPAPLRPPVGDRANLHRLDFTATDYAGNTLRRQWFVLIRPPAVTGLVTLRDDGVTLIDGRPFFPIGLYAVWKKPFNDNSFDRAFGDMRAAGFNFAHTYSSGRGADFSEFYAAAQRHGIKLFVASGGGANTSEALRVLADVVREEAQPALLAWYLADDTASWVGAGELGELSQAIHDVDPAHLTVQADGVGSPPRSRYRDFVGATDAFLPELYPIRDDGGKGVAQIIADMRTIRADLDHAGRPAKAIWAIVQDFQGWGWPRYPTRAELWAMSYLSLIHGATGITWYTYGGAGENHGVTAFPERWQAICELAGELSKLQDVFTERTGPQPPAPRVTAGPEQDALGQPSVSALLKEHAGQHWLLAASSADKPVTVRFSVAAGTVELPFENRKVAAEADGFTDTFEPFGVHVYRW
ncbi:MAG: hypothetical protein HYU66_03735 [Armatimonadetes bacterium]|nr:hypothetical protein [Armatimonadota bacterium]